MTSITKTHSRAARLLLIGCSSLALAVPAAANDVIFTTLGDKPVLGERTVQSRGVTQIALAGGGMVSISDAADYTINDDGSIDLYSGSITVSGGDSDVVIRMPEGLEGRVSGSGSSASFSVAADGSASGHTLTGKVEVGQSGRAQRPFDAGMMWTAAPGRGPRRSIANDAVAQPEPGTSPVIAISDDAGPVGAALNGIPVTLGDGLAGAGASADIIEAGRRIEAAIANPTIETFPVGDLALLVAAAARLENAYGGTPFNGAQADIIRTYLAFLASGASGAEFLTAYSAFLVDYLDLIRIGGVPSGFSVGVASPATIEAYLAFIARTGAIANLSASDRALADAYLAFIASGANRDLFAASLTDLTQAYFAFLRAGGAPGDFTGASQDALAQSIAFLSQSGVLAQLSAADRALVEAFLANGGIGFAANFQTALIAYFEYLETGALPSAYTVLDQATLQAYLETLQATGLLDALLGEQADFYADYLAFLQSGGNPDNFAGLPVPPDFPAFAAALNAYADFLAANGLPSDYSDEDIAQLSVFFASIQQTGQVSVLLGDNADLLSAYFAFLANGGAIDAFAGLPIYLDYAAALNAYATFLANGGLPSDYTVLDIDILEAYLAALSGLPGGAGGFDVLANNLALISAYFAFISGGGDIDGFTGLPVYADYVAALNAYFAFLEAGGLPSEYTALDLAILEAYLAALASLTGGLAGFDALNAFFIDYYAFLLDGGDPDQFAGLPGMGGGGEPGDPFGPGGPTLVYTGGFNGAGTGLFVQGSAQVPGDDPFLIRELIQGTAQDAILNADGGLERYRTNVGTIFNRFDRGTAKVEDISGNADVLIGRWSDGEYIQRSSSAAQPQTYLLNANQGFHYVLSDGFTGPSAFPTGRIEYDLLAATRPTTLDGLLAPGTFTANAAIIFGAAPKIAIEGRIAFDGLTYTFATPGGVAGTGNPLTISNQAGSTPGGYVFFRTDGTTNDGRGGPIFFDGRMADARGSSFGVVYRAEIFDPLTGGNFNALLGAAIFGAATTDSGTGGTGGGTGTGFTGTRDGQVYYAYLDGSLNTGFGGSADFVDGEITGLSSAVGTVSSNDTTIVEATDLGEVAWARWTDGTVQTGGLFGDVDYAIGANGGYHVMTGEVTTTLPGGTIAYELIGGTSATDNQGSTPGTITGDLAIAFGATSLVGYDLTMAVGGRSWEVSTPGGAANPAASNVNLVIGSGVWTFGGTFANTTGTVTAGGNACSGTCIVTVGGTMYGENAAYAALAMNVTDSSTAGVIGASGLAIFGQEGAATSMARSAAAIEPSSQAIADWSRWSGPGDTNAALSSGEAGQALAAIGATLATPQSGQENPANRAEAIERAEQLLGGAISWSPRLRAGQ